MNAATYQLRAKLLDAPLYLSAGHAERLKLALDQGALEQNRAGRVEASKFSGTNDARSKYRITEDGIAIVAVQGILIDRGAFLGDLNGFATSYEGLAEQFARLRKAETISAVILDIDSPGGMVAGLFDLVAELDKLKKAKPVYALAANMAASAAYAVACVAREVYVTRSGEAGAIGVIQIHQSYGRMMDKMGVDTTIICEPASKADGNPYNPLSHGARAGFAEAVGGAYARFVLHVAKYRGLSANAVRATQARAFCGKSAVDARLADGVLSFPELLEIVTKRHGRSRRDAVGEKRGEVTALKSKVAPLSRAARVERIRVAQAEIKFPSPVGFSNFDQAVATKLGGVK